MIDIFKFEPYEIKHSNYFDKYIDFPFKNSKTITINNNTYFIGGIINNNNKEYSTNKIIKLSYINNYIDYDYIFYLK